MAFKQTLTILDVFVQLKVNGEKVVQLFDEYGEVEASFQTVQGEQRATDSVKIVTVEVAKEFVGGTAKFYNENVCKHLRKLYDSKTHLQTLGVAANE